MHVLIDYSLHPSVTGFDHNEEPSRTEMAVYQALSTLVILGGKGDYHEYISLVQLVQMVWKGLFNKRYLIEKSLLYVKYI